MHMADALLAPAVAATMYVASGTVAGVSIHQLKKDRWRFFPPELFLCLPFDQFPPEVSEAYGHLCVDQISASRIKGCPVTFITFL